MKRGLVKLDPAETPDSERLERIAALQRSMFAEGIDVALIYGDVSRSDDIGYLTNLCIYWNEGILAVPAAGDPVFLTKLSPRVFGWMRLVSTVTDIRSGRKFGDLVSKLLTGDDTLPGTSDNSVIGLVGADLWPASVADEIRQALPGRHVREVGDLAREARLTPSGPELALLRQGGALLGRALGPATADGLTRNARIAAAERGLRGEGFLDVFARAEEAPDGFLSLQVTGQFRHLWLHASRLVGGPGTRTPDTACAAGPDWPASLNRALAAAVAAARPGVTADELTAAARPALAALPPETTARVRWTHQADMATGGEYVRYPADLPVPLGAAVVIAVDAEFTDGRHATAADTVAVTDNGTQSLTESVPDEPTLEAAR
jgi:Xaa-Pro aminopeptidase